MNDAAEPLPCPPCTLRRTFASTAWLRLSVVGVTALVDWSFYRQPCGWLYGAVPLLVGLLLVARPARPTNRSALALALAVLSLAAGAVVYRGGLLGRGLVLTALGAMAGARATPGLRHAGDWAAAAARVPVGLAARGWRDRRLLRRRRRRPWRATGAALRTLLRWVLPVGLGTVFLILFAVANPIIRRGIDQSVCALLEILAWVRLPSLARVCFWAVVAGVLWGLWRMRAPRAGRCVRPPPLPGAPEPAVERSDALPLWAWPSEQPALALRCLGVVNAIFLLETVVDLIYLWGGRALPVGMSHAAYAHRGAYPLVASALLSGALVLLFFQPGRAVEAHRAARVLVWLWLAQNVQLTLSAAWRLHLYIDARMLTRLRLEALVWMGLVAFGLAAIGWRIAVRRANRWLVDVNAVALLAVLLAYAWWPADAFIARYNVRTCREANGPGRTLDVNYLQCLGFEALPALRAYARMGAPLSGKAERLATQRSAELQALLANPRGWTWRRGILARGDSEEAP